MRSARYLLSLPARRKMKLILPVVAAVTSSAAIRRFTVAFIALASAVALTALAAPASSALAGSGPARTLVSASAAPAGYFHLVNASSGMCLGVQGARLDAPAIQWPCENTPNQYWKVGRSGPLGYTEVINDTSAHQCLGVAGGSTLQGAQIVAWTCQTGAGNQYWDVGNVSPGYVLTNFGSTPMVMGVQAASLSQGAAIIQWWPVIGALNQHWYEESF